MTQLFAYFGPETVMPMTSIVATVAAMVMMFGKTAFRFACGSIMLLKGRRRKASVSPSRPHFGARPQHGRNAGTEFEHRSSELVEN